MTEPLRPLSPDALKAHVADLLAQQPNIPPTHHGAMVAVVNLDYVQITIATRTDDTWTVALTTRKAWHGDAVIQGQITKTW
jgi:hypothetical protein